MKKRFSAVLLLTTLLASFVCGCGEDALPVDTSFAGRIRSTYGTYKVMRNDDDFADLGEQITVNMVKNETEGGQLVITPNKRVASYEVKANDLVNEKGTVFPKEQIKTFVQTYLHIQSKTPGQTNDEYPTGYIPDMMLPIELATEEELVIEAGNNQSLTVEFTTTLETEAGTYTGYLDLLLGSTEKKIPVTVNVYDIGIDQMYGKTSFGLSNNYLLAGELNSTWEMYTTYYETMLNDYKICASFVPYYDVSAEAWADSVVHYYDHPNFTSFSVPYYGLTITESKEMNKELFKDYLYALAQKCSKDKIYFDKAYIYMQPNDEPYSEEDYAHVKSVIEDIDEAKVEVFARLQKENFFAGDSDYEAAFQESFYYFENVVTSVYKEELGDVISGYCPHIENYNTEAAREQYTKTAEASKGEKWFYTAMEVFPWASCAIDDYAIGNRLLHWMQMAYDIEGYLYYDVAIYNNFITGEMLNPYENPVRFSNKSGGYPGDGYIFYPTIKYGAEKPIGSWRAVSYRDGREDLALLNVVEQAIDEVAASYGVTASSNELLSSVYDSVFTGAVYNTDDAAFAKARTDLFKFYETVSGEAGYIPEKSVVVGNRASVNIYTAQGVDLYMDGVKQTGTSSGAGVKYTLEKTLQSNRDVFAIEVKKGDEILVKQSIATGAVVNQGADLSKEESAMHFAVSEHGEMTVDTANKEVDYVLRSYGGESVTDMLRFKPFAAIKPTAIGGSLGEVESLTFTVRNDSAADIALTVNLRVGVNDTALETVHIKAGESVTVVVANFAAVGNANDIDMIALTAANHDSSYQLLPDRYISIFDMKYTLK